MQHPDEVEIVDEWWDDGFTVFRWSLKQAVLAGRQGNRRAQAQSFLQRVTKLFGRDEAAPTAPASSSSSTAQTSVAQIAECRVGGRHIVAVIFARPALATASERLAMADRIRNTVHPTVLAYVTASSEGHCTLDDSFLASEEDATLAAQACAVIAASWAWDGSKTLAVHIGSRTLQIEPRFGAGPTEGRRWTASRAG